jgi:hypothetical protein
LKNILIVSSEEWNFIQISKHHYARAAADSGYQVYFLEPPDQTVKALTFTPTEHPRISRVRYPMVRYCETLRFHARPVYRMLEKVLISSLAKSLPPLDLVWSFDRNRFSSLRRFGARKVIYHPVDSVAQAHQLWAARDADQIYCVSKTILAPFLHMGPPAAVMPHGVSPAFARLAEKSSTWDCHQGPRKVGFAGNLSRPIVARLVILTLMRENPCVEFHFWGQAEAPRNADIPTIEFLAALKAFPNCRLRGVQSADVFASQLEEMDIFLLAYQKNPKDPDFDFSNSHKVLEYLSTGRVVLSSPLSEYDNHPPDFIVFADGNTMESFVRQFSRVLGDLEYLNGPVLAKLRRAYALENSYSHHWEKIRSIVEC